MSDPTKSCALTEEEIKTLIGDHGRNLIDYGVKTTVFEDKIERINYLNKRLKAFSEPDKPNGIDTPAATPPVEQKAW